MEDQAKKKLKGRKGGAHIFKSTEGLSKRFIDLCLEEVGKEGYLGSSLKAVSWNRIKETLNKEFAYTLPAALDQKTLKNHWDYLKKRFLLWRSIVGLSGHGYNAETGMLNWPETKWSEVIEREPKAKHFKEAGLMHANDLSKLFDGVMASGDESWVHAPTGVLHPHLKTNPNDVVEEEGTMSDSYWQDVHINNAQNAEPVTPADSNTSTSHDSGKRKRNEAISEIDGQIEQVVGLVKEQFLFYKSYKEEKKAAKETYSLRECMVDVSAIKKCNEAPLLKLDYSIAMVKLAQSFDMRKAFLELGSLEEKLDFIFGLSNLK